MVAATPRQTTKRNLNQKSNRKQQQSCGAVETTTPTQRQKTKQKTQKNGRINLIKRSTLFL